MNDVVTRLDQPTPATVRTPVTPLEMAQQAIERGASLEIVDKLMTLHERWEANQARKAFDQAIAQAKSQIPVISKNRTVDFTSSKGRTNYRYEDLGEIARVVSPILSEHGLSYRFRTSTKDKVVEVTCIISHRDGHFEENSLIATHDDSGNKNSIQALGSAVTYLQRITLKSALGLAASTDDDGHGTGKNEPVTFITDEQIDLIRKEMKDRGIDEKKFCDFAGLEGIGDMHAKFFDTALAKVKLKKKAEHTNA